MFVHLSRLLVRECVDVHRHIKIYVAIAVLVLIVVLLLLLLLSTGRRRLRSAVLVDVTNGSLLIGRFLLVLVGLVTDRTVLFLEVYLRQEFLFGHSEEVVFDQNAISLVVGLTILPRLVVWNPLGVSAFVFSDVIEVSSAVKPVDHGVHVTLPGHHVCRTVGCLRHRRIQVNLALTAVQL